MCPNIQVCYIIEIINRMRRFVVGNFLDGLILKFNLHINMQQKTLIPIVIGVLIIFAGTWFYLSGGDNKESKTASDSIDILAQVNGEEINKEAFETAKAQFITTQNIEVASLDEETLNQLNTQVLDSLINNSLVQQATKESKVKVSDEDVDAQIDLIKSQFEDEAAFLKVLSEQGISETELRSQVVLDIAAQTYLESVLDLDSITVTEEEVDALYKQEASVDKDLPALSEIKGQIEAFIVQQKQQELFSLHIQKLREDADIEILN